MDYCQIIIHVASAMKDEKKEPGEEFKSRLVEKLPNLTRFAWILCSGDTCSDDLVQATCERALSRWTQFRPGTRFDSWLFSIMHSIWKNDYRRQSNERKIKAALRYTDNKVDGEDIAERKVYLSQVLSRLSQLPEHQAIALTLVYLEQHTYREAAEILGIPQGTLESRLARGRIALGRALDEQRDLGSFLDQPQDGRL